MKSSLAYALVAALALAPLPTLAQETNLDELSATELRKIETPTFVKLAVAGSLFEIQSSRIALKMAQDPQVKEFAQMMIDDHQKAIDRFKEAVAKGNERAIEIKEVLDAREQKMVDQLNAQKVDFDPIYVRMQIQAHRAAVKLFTAYSEVGQNETLKMLAAERLPTLKQHLALAERLPGAAAAETGSTKSQENLGQSETSK
jgi:putative membrane protein